jgi:Fe-S cluster assembly protein SufD
MSSSSQSEKSAIISAQTRLKLDSGFRRNDETDHLRLLFLNGILQVEQSQLGISPPDILKGDLEAGYTLSFGEQDPIAHPLELVFSTDNRAPQEIPLKFSIDIGSSAQLALLENYASSNAPTTVETDITLHPHANFTHGKIVAGGVHLAMTKLRASTGCTYNNFSLLRGGAPVRNEIDVLLDGEEAQASLNGIMLLRGKDHADTTTRITHHAPRCTSRQVCKTVLDGPSHGVFQGKIVVAKDAQKSDGYQLSRALLLSDRAEMDVRPELEIFADDIKCSHGSTIGDLDENALFYLRSRGLSEEQARSLLIEGFVSETLDEIVIEAWRDIFRREVEEGTI